MQMRTLAIVPARGGSKRLPQKNLRLLRGKPLIGWVIEAARAAKCLDRIVVSSDDPEILAWAERYDSRLPLRRPAELARDTSPAIDYVRHAIGVLEGCGDVHYEVVVILQPSSPLTSSEDIERTVDLLIHTGADTAVSIVKLEHAVHPVKLKVLNGDLLLPYVEKENGRMAAHELPDVYVRNCSVYATRRLVVDQGRIIGSDCRGYVMPRERSIDINDEIDLQFAEFLLARVGSVAK